MGIAGLGIAWRIASGLIGVPPVIGEVAVALAFILFILISMLFIAKALLRPDRVVEIWKDNRAILFVPMIPTSLLLLSIGARPYDIGFATLLWQIAAPLNMILAIVIVGRWLFDEHELAMVSPAWMFPVVGNGVVPIAGVPLGFVNAGWAFFSTSFVLWVITFVVLFSRFVLGGALAKSARPTILILISPPATFFIAYSELSDAQIDMFSHSMIYFSLFLLAVFLLNGKWIFHAPFSIASWSLTFPMAALTIASLLFYRATGWDLAQWTATGLLGLTTVFVVSVTVLGLGVTLRNLCQPTAI
jgi:tellurite resistance protein